MKELLEETDWTGIYCERSWKGVGKKLGMKWEGARKD